MKAVIPTVYVVDDDVSVLKALERLIRSAGFNAETFDSAWEFLKRGSYDRPCCLVLDVRMPDLSGIDLQQELSKLGLSIPIIFLTGHGTIPMSVQAMKAGAVDFLTKPCNDEELLQTIHQSIEKNRLEISEQAGLDSIRRRIDSLTKRENQVFLMVIAGMLNKQAGYELGISEKTVKTHRARVMQKMQADSIAELVRLAERVDITPHFMEL
jgi:FixJ family two-component response regulator